MRIWLFLISLVLAARLPRATIGAAERQQLLDRIDGLVQANPIMIFSKSTCKWCKKVKAVLVGADLSYRSINLDQQPMGMAMWDLLEELTGQKTVPNVFIGGKHVGGCDAVTKLHQRGLLVKMVAKAQQH